MKKIIRPVLAATFCLVLGACGGEGDDSGTNQTCNSTHECVNDACMCTTEGKAGQSCEQDQCETDCRVCTSE